MPRIPEDSKNRISEAFQKRMLAAIEEKDLSKKDFALSAGVNKDVIIRATVYGILPSVKTLVKIADFLQCSLNYLLGEEEQTLFVPSQAGENFYVRLKGLAEERQMKLSALSRFMSFAPNSVYEWIRTKSLPSLDYLLEIADFFDVSMDYLLGRTDYRN